MAKLGIDLKGRKSKADYLEELPVITRMDAEDSEEDLICTDPCTIMDVSVNDDGVPTAILIKHFNIDVHLPYNLVKQDSDGRLYVPRWLAEQKEII